jgi:hypothetical protein
VIKNMKTFLQSLTVAIVAMVQSANAASTVVPIVEDVMTSSFFQGTNLVRGYAGDNRPTFRVSTNDPFGTTGAETIYITFDSSSFSSFTSPVSSAVLTVTSKSGGFGADAGPGNPFTVSAHGVASNPLTTIMDDTNPGGTKSWLAFYTDDILPADPAALTSVDSFGLGTFDVTTLVNDWISGANTVFALALTGKNDTSGNEFLHGFQNNTELLGSTFLTVTTVPEPSSMLLGMATLVCGCGLRRRVS